MISVAVIFVITMMGVAFCDSNDSDDLLML